jgi:hypothetical protein
MIEIDVTQYTSASDAYDAGEAAFVAANPEPVKPEKTIRFSRPVLIKAGKNSRLWIEAKQDSGWGDEPYDPHFFLRSHELTDSAEMELEEVRVLIQQLTEKLSEAEAAASFRAEFKAWKHEHSAWEQQKGEAGTASRLAWRKAQQELKPTPTANDYTDDEIEEDYQEEDYDDSDDDL